MIGYAVVISDSGIVDDVVMFKDSGKAMGYADGEWHSMIHTPGFDECKEDESWHNDEADVWVFDVDEYHEDQQAREEAARVTA